MNIVDENEKRLMLGFGVIRKRVRPFVKFEMKLGLGVWQFRTRARVNQRRRVRGIRLLRLGFLSTWFRPPTSSSHSLPSKARIPHPLKQGWF